jgi:hypothetical protein
MRHAGGRWHQKSALRLPFECVNGAVTERVYRSTSGSVAVVVAEGACSNYGRGAGFVAEGSMVAR